MTVNTKDVQDRRTLSFQKIEDLKAEIDRIASTSTQVSGNWTAGQIIEHLASTMRMAITRNLGWKAPLLMRILSPICFKKKFLTQTIPSGFNIPDGAKHLFAPPEKASIQEAAETFNKAYENYINSSFVAKHPFLGKLTRDQWDQFQLRHAEMHLSFVMDVAENSE
jgi:hypothetical protein